ncbi:MAG: CBS domain-containing protein [Planctomycetota bacterium]|jgi:CBS domain-containing protein
MSLCAIGTRDLVSVPPEATVLQIAGVMRGRNVGSVVVVEDGLAVGIVTDRDLVLRAMLAEKAPAALAARDVMTTALVTAHDDLDPAEAAWRMREHRIRRLPIVDDRGRALGIVTLDDLVGYIGSSTGEMTEIIASFHAPYQGV